MPSRCVARNQGFPEAPAREVQDVNMLDQIVFEAVAFYITRWTNTAIVITRSPEPG
jgi:hypothetical protein